MADAQIPYILRGVLGAVKLALDPDDISLADQTAVCLVALRVALATTLALRISGEEVTEQSTLETHLQD